MSNQYKHPYISHGYKYADNEETRTFINNRLATIGCTLGNPEKLRWLSPYTTSEAVAFYCENVSNLQGEYLYKWKYGWGPLRFYREGNVVSITVYHGEYERPE